MSKVECLGEEKGYGPFRKARTISKISLKPTSGKFPQNSCFQLYKCFGTTQLIANFVAVLQSTAESRSVKIKNSIKPKGVFLSSIRPSVRSLPTFIYLFIYLFIALFVISLLTHFTQSTHQS